MASRRSSINSFSGHELQVMRWQPPGICLDALELILQESGAAHWRPFSRQLLARAFSANRKDAAKPPGQSWSLHFYPACFAASSCFKDIVSLFQKALRNPRPVPKGPGPSRQIASQGSCHLLYEHLRLRYASSTIIPISETPAATARGRMGLWSPVCTDRAFTT